MIAADFKAGVIDRDEARVALGYESEPEYRGQFAVEAKAAEAGGADDAELKANWREWLHRRGKSTPGTNSGSFTSGSGAKPGVFQNSGAFDASHKWYGDLIPPESKEIQEAKAKIMVAMLPYTRFDLLLKGVVRDTTKLDRNLQALIVDGICQKHGILKRTGRRY